MRDKEGRTERYQQPRRVEASKLLAFRHLDLQLVLWPWGNSTPDGDQLDTIINVIQFDHIYKAIYWRNF